MTQPIQKTEMEIILQGQIDEAVSPLNAMTDMLSFLQTLPEQFSDSGCEVKVVHAALGEAEYSAEPESAKIMALVQSNRSLTSDAIKMAIKVKLADICEVSGMNSQLSWAAQ
ncbi:hypothetical protein [Vibrio sp. HN007]|uniref:hypothetical protein n=1 Tax=Vibrio iocasae TaxID=3098914 RepID=UPI0035D3FE09